MHESNRPEPPRHLSADAKRRWKSLLAEYPLDDTAALTLLQAALEAFDQMNDARKLLKREGFITTDRFGKPKQHPATFVMRDARQQLLAAFKALRLDPISNT